MVSYHSLGDKVEPANGTRHDEIAKPSASEIWRKIKY